MEFGIGLLVDNVQMVEEAPTSLGFRCDFRQPNGGFHGFHLAEERAGFAELVMPPMLKQAGRFRSYLPLAGVR